MKKHLRTLILGGALITGSSVYAQSPVGTVVPNFTLTDISGTTTFDLYSHLNAGETVVIDVSAAWCGPCWAYHGTGALNSFQTSHGPSGTGDGYAVFIEGDPSTSTACLYGPTGSCAALPSGSTTTQGDWVTGETMPIIDLASTSAFPLIIPYYPVMYVICPNRIVSQSGVAGSIGTTASLDGYVTACYKSTAALDAGTYSTADLNQNLMSCDSVNVSVRLINYGSTTMTSASIDVKVDGVTVKTINWTGSLTTYDNAIVSCGKVGAASAGTHTVTFVAKNPNGGTDAVAGNDSDDATFTLIPSTGGSPVAEPFTVASYPPSGWTITNGGDPSYTWNRFTATQADGTSGGTQRIQNYYISSGDVDDIQVKGSDISSLSTPTLTFDVAHQQYASGYNDNLKVYASTNCGATWSQIYTKSGATLASVTGYTGNVEFVPSAGNQWRHETISLSAFSGSSNLLLKFRGTSAYGNDVYVDNVNIANATAIEELNNDFNFSVYPNPASSMINVGLSITEASNVRIYVRNNVGQIVQTVNNNTMPVGNHNIQVSLPDIENGVYFVQVVAGNSTSSKKVTVIK